MYYLLDNDDFEEKNYFDLNGTLYNNEKEIAKTIFDDGKVHGNMNAPYTLILDESDSSIKGKKYSDMISSFVIDSGALFLISPKAQDLLMKLVPNDIEMYDVCIKGSNFELSDYKIVKILDKIDCVNLDDSDLEYLEKYDVIDSAEELVLDEDKIPKGKQLFLLGKRSTGVIVIHEKLKKSIEKEGLTGLKFYTLEEAYMVIA